jgi:hypothetical protein
MNVLLGGALVALGLLFASQVPVILGLLPVWALAAFLAYAGLRHAWLVSDLSGLALGLAVVAGGVGAALGNLAVTAALALLVDHARRLRSAARSRTGQPRGAAPRPGSYSASAKRSS